MGKNIKSDLEKLRDSIAIHRVSEEQRKTKKSGDLKEFSSKKPKGKIKVLGLGNIKKN